MAKITLKINDKNDKCLLILDESIDEATKEDIIEKLNAKNIKHGVKTAIIDEVLAGDHKLSESIVIAQNIPALRGRDGELKYLPIKEKKQDVEGNENIDFYNVGIIKNVLKDTKLVEILPPGEGKSGITMFGDTIPNVTGRPASYNKFSGPGTKVTPDTKYIVADKDGVYQKNPIGVITIADELEIKGSIDFSIGNIDTSSAVIIRGDIKAGFSCKSGSSITIDGVVEDASVIANDNIICKLGILPGVEPIKSKNSIRVRYIRDRETVECKDLTVEEMISGSNIKSLGSVESKKIVGGSLSVKSKITADEIGNEQFTPTQIEVGVNYKIISRMNENRKELSENKKIISDKTNELNDLEIETKKHLNNSGNKAVLDKLTTEQKSYKNKINILNSEITQLNNNIERLAREYKKLNNKIEGEDPEIVVNKTIYPNTSIKMKMGKVFEVKEEMTKVKLRIDENGNKKVLKF